MWSWSAHLFTLMQPLSRPTKEGLRPWFTWRKKQSELLHAVVEGDLLSRDKLEADGVCWPKTNRDRVPKYLLEEGDDFFVTQ